MKILILCGYFAHENEREVIQHARRVVEFSANMFQKRLISGFRELETEVQVLSAPFIGSFPNGSDMLTFRGFADDQSECDYVHFHNLWGLRNLSRSAAVKRGLQPFIEAEDEQKIIVVYSAHTPFIEAARYAKRKDGRIKVCMYFPDLPHYMNMSADRSPLYDVIKKYDIRHMLRQMDCADAYVLLTEQMKQLLPVGEKPCLIREGIVDALPIEEPAVHREKNIVYTGKLEEAFGVGTLLDAFALLEDPDYRLVLCGRGDCEEKIRNLARQDPRIQYRGQVTPEEARLLQNTAAVLVNPRPDAGEYTKYSFPSKNVDYLLSGRPVVACMLSGMPRQYRDFLYVIEDNTPQSLARTLTAAMEDTPENCRRRYLAFRDYAATHLLAKSIAGDMIDLCK